MMLPLAKNLKKNKNKKSVQIWASSSLALHDE
jgi:hypothetical protein